MCPIIFDPLYLRNPNVYLPVDGNLQSSCSGNFWKILKKFILQIAKNLKGDFQTFDPLFSVSTPQGKPNSSGRWATMACVKILN
jgi:hypothetical protein